jgi:hypothetical protein
MGHRPAWIQYSPDVKIEQKPIRLKGCYCLYAERIQKKQNAHIGWWTGALTIKKLQKSLVESWKRSVFYAILLNGAKLQ